MARAAFPDWIVPMAATLTKERFTGPEWIFERKLDGIRLIAYRRGAGVRLFSRNRLEIPQTPFTKAIGLPRLRAHWVRPEIVVQVGFLEWTVHGKLRHPRLLGIRTDKSPLEVVREAP